MSYILGALQKADRERSKKRGLSLDNLSEMPAESGAPSRTSGPAVLVALLIATATILVLFLGWTFTQPEPLIEPAFVTPDSAAEVVPTRSPASLPLRPSAETSSTLPNQLPIEGIVFVEDRPGQARVFLQGRGYRTGDSFEGLLIQSINASSVTLSNGTTSRTYRIP